MDQLEDPAPDRKAQPAGRPKAVRPETKPDFPREKHGPIPPFWARVSRVSGGENRERDQEEGRRQPEHGPKGATSSSGVIFAVPIVFVGVALWHSELAIAAIVRTAATATPNATSP